MKSMAQILNELATTRPSGMTEEQIRQNELAILRSRGIKCPDCLDSGVKTVRVEIPEPEGSPWQPATQIVASGVCETCGGETLDELQAERRIKAAGVSSSAARYNTFATWEPLRNPVLVPVYTALRLWVDAPVGGVILTGPNGVGKTHLAIAAAVELAHSGLAVRYWESRRLVDRLRTAVGDGDIGEELRWLREGIGILIVDDWKAERETEFTSDALEDVLASRYEMGRPFIVTTNTGPSQWGPRLASRFSDARRVTVYLCDGADVRPMLERLR